AVLQEARLIKDIKPPYNTALADDKSFPYLMITTREDFPGVYITRQPSKGARLFGPFTNAGDLRPLMVLLQKIFKFRTCKLDIDEGDDSRRHFRPCILHNIKQCTAPCAARVSKEDYRDQINKLRRFLESKGTQLKKEIEAEMQEASKNLQFEKAAELRDQLRALAGLQKRGLVEEHVQPEAFFVDPADGLVRLGEALGMDSPPRTIEGFDIAHLQGGEMCGSEVCFIDGKPFKEGYRRYKIKTVEGNDDFACMREVVWRRYKYAALNEGLFPDVVLIDGGRGQLNAAHSAFEDLPFSPPMLISLAKQNEEIFLRDRDKPIRLPRRDPALRILQSVRDEAHRFVQHYHHILRQKALLGDYKPKRRRGRKRHSQD
ncbi:MAG: UvrB/UvrC motif-containing protein, partial [Planctomycetota bacterium]